MTNRPAPNQHMIDAARLMEAGWSFHHERDHAGHHVTAAAPDNRLVIAATRDRQDDALRVTCLLARMAHILPL